MLLRQSHRSANYQAALDTAVWLVQLRWFAVAGQCLAIAITAWLLRAPLPLPALAAAVGVTVASNLALMVWLRGLKRRWLGGPGGETPSLFERRVASLENVLGGSLLVDVLTLTALLHLTGGVANPFSCFYFANIAVCGLVLAPRWTWAVSGLSVAGVLLLLVDSRPLPLAGFEVQSSLPFFSIQKQGSFVALATCCLVVTYFINVLMTELRSRERRLATAELERAKSQRLEAMATLAAGAGHELASPLSTIAVVSKELARRLEKIDVPRNIVRDVELIRSELDRCREVLSRLKSGAGEASAEGFQPVSAAQLAAAVTAALREPHRVVLELPPPAGEATARLPLQALSQALRNLVQNALDASPPPETVRLAFEVLPAAWTVRVIDRGGGMPAETLERVGQPFFTTKAVGKGMGLGVFLTQNVVRGLGGSLRIDSRPGQGTTCLVTIPASREGGR